MLIKNAGIVNPWSEAFGDILISHGKIKEIGKTISGHTGEHIDIEGDMLFPGFIDVHIQGAGGYDVLDGGEAIDVISETCVRFGVTSFLATTVYKPGLENKH